MGLKYTSNWYESCLIRIALFEWFNIFYKYFLNIIQLIFIYHFHLEKSSCWATGKTMRHFSL